jgi:hypothetical protein
MRFQILKRNCKIAAYLFLSTLFTAAFVARSQAQGAGQRTFSSSKEARTAFIQAAREGDPSGLGAILGPGSEQVVSSSDSVADKAARETFLKWYYEGHSLVPAHNGEFTLEAGRDEILYRRIGHNELAALNVCEGIVAAQRDYAASAHDGKPAGAYAARIVSEPGKQNGLYWEVKEGEPESPAGPMIADAASEGYDTSGKRTPYHGYYYRMLPGATGFGFVAYPADYRASGVMTFLVSQKGVIYQKDLGAKTAGIAQQMSSYAPDKTWSVVK